MDPLTAAQLRRLISRLDEEDRRQLLVDNSSLGSIILVDGWLDETGGETNDGMYERFNQAMRCFALGLDEHEALLRSVRHARDKSPPVRGDVARAISDAETAWTDARK